MCVGVAVTVVFLPLFIVGGPLFLVGLGLVWASGRPVWARLLATVVPVVGWVGVAAGAWLLAPRTPAATFLVPQGFEGTIMLVLNEPCGLPPEKTDGRLIYRVPANGLIITQNKAPDPNSPAHHYERPDNRYYVVDGQGRHLRELTEVQNTTEAGAPPEATSSFKTVGSKELAAFFDTPMETASTPSEISYTFQYLTITTQARLFSDRNMAQQYRVRTLADSLVARCRARSRPPSQQRKR